MPWRKRVHPEGKIKMMDDGTARQMLNRIAEKDGGRVFFDERLATHSTIGIGAAVFAWYEPASIDGLYEAMAFSRNSGLRTLIVGKGSNMLMPDTRLRALAIHLSGDNFTESSFDGNRFTAGAGKPLSSLISVCASRGLAGMEGLIGIPGTVGGALMSNAGYKCVISDVLERVKVLDSDGRLKSLAKDDIEFGYRKASFSESDTIIEASFTLKFDQLSSLRERMKNYFVEKMESQPLDEKTLGCVFKNPDGGKYKSAQLIDMAGLKGTRVGGAAISSKHANFIVNAGGATARDVKELIQKIKEKVYADFSVALETEIRILQS